MYIGNYNVDGIGTPASLLYGESPNNPKTWDSDKIYGCQPDSYEYYDDSVTDGIQKGEYTQTYAFDYIRSIDWWIVASSW